MLKDYFTGFSVHFMTLMFTTRGIDLQVGFAVGCMILIILFVMAMQVILFAAISYAPGPSLNGEFSLSALRTFMDNTTMLTPDVSRALNMLARLGELISR